MNRILWKLKDSFNLTFSSHTNPITILHIPIFQTIFNLPFQHIIQPFTFLILLLKIFSITDNRLLNFLNHLAALSACLLRLFRWRWTENSSLDEWLDARLDSTNAGHLMLWKWSTRLLMLCYLASMYVDKVVLRAKDWPAVRLVISYSSEDFVADESTFCKHGMFSFFSVIIWANLYFKLLIYSSLALICY